MTNPSTPIGQKLINGLIKQYPQIPRSIFFTMTAADKKELWNNPSVLDEVVERSRNIRRKYDGYKGFKSNAKPNVETAEPNTKSKAKRKYVRRPGTMPIMPSLTPNNASLNTLTKSLLLIQIASVLEEMSVNDALQVLPMMQQISNSRR